MDMMELGVGAGLTMAGGLVSWAIQSAYKGLADGQTRLTTSIDTLAHHVGITNGRLGRVEEWQSGHEQIDHERFESLKDKLDGIEERLNHKGA